MVVLHPMLGLLPIVGATGGWLPLGGPFRPARLHLKPEAPEAGARVLPVQGHGEPLLEHDGAGAAGFELARSQSRRFGKLGPDTPGHFTPATASGFHDHRDERDTLALAQRPCIFVNAFEVFVLGQNGPWVSSRIGHRLNSKATGDGEVQRGGWAGPPPGDIDISRAPGARVRVLLCWRASVLVGRPMKRPVW